MKSLKEDDNLEGLHEEKETKLKQIWDKYYNTKKTK